MVTGRDLKKGRNERRLTLAQAGDVMRVGARTVGRWESKDELPESAIPVVEKFLGLAGEEPDALVEMTNPELVAHLMSAVTELARRLPPPDARRRGTPGEGIVEAAYDASGYDDGLTDPRRRA